MTMLVLLLGLWIGVSIGLLLGASWTSWRIDRRDECAPLSDAPWHACTACGRTSPTAIPVDRNGWHAHAAGGYCDGRIVFAPRQEQER